MIVNHDYETVAERFISIFQIYNSVATDDIKNFAKIGALIKKDGCLCSFINESCSSNYYLEPLSLLHLVYSLYIVGMMSMVVGKKF